MGAERKCSGRLIIFAYICRIAERIAYLWTFEKRSVTVNYVDVLILVPVAYGAFRGFHQGLLMEVSTLFALILGVVVALRFAGDVEGVLRDFVVLSEPYSYYAAFAVTFLLVIVVINLLGKFLTRLVDAVSLGLFNKVFGILLGMLKGVLVVCVVLFVVNALDRKYDFIPAKTKSESLLYSPFVNFANGVYKTAVEE